MENKATVIVGAQWGDEGKGKIVNFLAKDADAVVRYQGGNNAGHTIYYKKEKIALKHIPSGILNKNTQNFIGQGCVVNPLDLMEEIKELQKNNFYFDNLLISEKAHIILPYHIDIDTKIEEIKSDSGDSIGTTKKGIGPCYEDKYARIGIRAIDFINPEIFAKKLKKALLIKNLFLKSLGLSTYSPEEIVEKYKIAANFLKNKIKRVSFLIENLIKENKKVIFEGAQGVMLCIENGTYPYVTSSSSSSASVALGSGINPHLINKTVSITKAYTTRVGAGEFPSEIKNKDVFDHIQTTGNEFGTVTKRMRRIGWLDTVILNHSYNLCGTTGIALTLLDVLSKIKILKICKSYLLNNKKINFIPANNEDLKKIKPVFIEMPGWEEDISQIKNYEYLPKNAKKYIKKIEELTRQKITIISVGPKSDQTFFR